MHLAHNDIHGHDATLPATSLADDTSPHINSENHGDKSLAAKTLTDTVKQIEPTPIKTPNPTDADNLLFASTQPKGTFAKITIKTSKKTGIFVVMPDVRQKTLKDNIGWLPSSSLPGEQGVCVFMGHRDTDFKILKYLQIGDELIVERHNQSFYYTVSKIEIVNSDNELRFDTITDASLALVTCYPFHYSGHAPKKFVAYLTITNFTQ
jgi:sortase A